MKAALQILGYNDCYHFFNVYGNIQDSDMWIEAFKAKYRNPDGRLKFGRKEWDGLLGHCAAVTDAPCNAFGPELIEAYPEAKVILIERDIDAWYRSFKIVMETTYRPDFKIAAFLDPLWMGRVYKTAMIWVECHFGALRQSEFEAKAKETYRAHYAELRQITPKARLLNYKLGSGWEPLCKFLGKEIPEAEFPWINEAAALKEKMDVLGRKSMGRALRNVGIVVSTIVVIGVLIWFWPYR